MLKQTPLKSMRERMWWIGDWWGYIDEQSGGTWWNIYCVKSDILIYNIMAKMAMKDKKTENSRETTAAALRRLWSYGSNLIWIHVVKQVSFSFLFGVQNAIEFFFGIDRFIYIYIYKEEKKIMERLLLQAGNWEINSYRNYFPAVSYWLHCSFQFKESLLKT